MRAILRAGRDKSYMASLTNFPINRWFGQEGNKVLPGDGSVFGIGENCGICEGRLERSFASAEESCSTSACCIKRKVQSWVDSERLSISKRITAWKIRGIRKFRHSLCGGSCRII